MDNPEKGCGTEVGPGDMSHDDWETSANNWFAPSGDTSGRVKREPRFPFSSTATRPLALRAIPLQNKALRAFVNEAKQQQSQLRGDLTSVNSPEDFDSEEEAQAGTRFAVTSRPAAAGGVTPRPGDSESGSLNHPSSSPLTTIDNTLTMSVPPHLRPPNPDATPSVSIDPPKKRPARRPSVAETVDSAPTDALLGNIEQRTDRYVAKLEARLKDQFPTLGGAELHSRLIQAATEAYFRAAEAEKAKSEAEAAAKATFEESLAPARPPVRGRGRTRGVAPQITATRVVTGSLNPGPARKPKDDDLDWSRPQIARSGEKTRGKPPEIAAKRNGHAVAKSAVSKKPKEEENDAWGPAPVLKDEGHAWGALPTTSGGLDDSDAWGPAPQRSAVDGYAKSLSSRNGPRHRTTYSSDSDADSDFIKASHRRLQAPAIPLSKQSARSSSGQQKSQAGSGWAQPTRTVASATASRIQPSPYKPPQSSNPYSDSSDLDNRPRVGLYDEADSSQDEDITRSGLTSGVTVRKLAPTGEAGQWTSRFDCNMEGCGFNSTTLKAMINHKIDDHHVCTKCDQEFKDAGSLRMHKQISASHNVCWTCGADFNTVTARNRHVATAHPSKKELQCPGCGLTYPNQTSFVLHLEQEACPQITEAQFQTARDMIGNINNVDVVEVVDEPHRRQPPFGQGSSQRAAVPGLDPAGSDDDPTGKLPGSHLPVEDRSVSAAGAIHGLVKKLETTTIGGPMTSIALLPREQRLFQLHQRIFGPSRKKGPDVPRTDEGEILMSALPDQPGYNPSQFYQPMSRTFLCPYPNCRKRAKTENGLDSHIRSSAHSNDDLRCPECHGHFKSGASLTAHLEATSTKCYARDSEMYKEIIEVVSGAFLTVHEALDGREEIVVQQPTW